MSRRGRKPRRQAGHPPVTFTLALRVLAAGQRLRADETASSATFAVFYAAKRAQGGSRP